LWAGSALAFQELALEQPDLDTLSLILFESMAAYKELDRAFGGPVRHQRIATVAGRHSAVLTSSRRLPVHHGRRRHPLQNSITGPARATVTSLGGMSTLLLYGSYAALADLGGHGGAFALLALPYLAISLWLLTSRVLDLKCS
jgi:hypothetical protein